MAGILAKSPRRGLLRGPFAPLREELEELFGRFWPDEGDGWSMLMLSPPLDMSETDTAVRIRMDLPGVAPNEIDIQVSGNQLTVTGERKEESEEKGATFHRIERRTGQFSRSITLPCTVDEGKIDAMYQDGVLCISLPKSEESRPRHIKVKAK